MSEMTEQRVIASAKPKIGARPQPAAVPEPASLMLFGSGLIGVAGAIRRRWAR